MNNTICCLCLNDTKELLLIFNENSEEKKSEIAKIITKYFYIELHNNDRLCTACWESLHNFHKFWLSIEEKQEELRHRVLHDIKVDPIEEENSNVVNDFAATITISANKISATENEQSADIKDITSLSEPQIDVPHVEEDAEIIGAQEFNFMGAEDDDDATKDGSVLDHPTIKNVAPQTAQTSKRKYAKRKLKSDITCRTRSSSNKKLCNSKTSTSTTKNSKKAKEITETVAHTNEAKISSHFDKTETIRELDDYIAKNSDLNCCLCKETLADFAELKRHFRSVHHCRGYVPCCNNRFTKRFLYVDHLKMHNDPEYFKCHLCNKVLASRNSHVNHMATSHPSEDELKFQCDFCPRKFARQYILDYHLKSHSSERSEHICEICKKGYRTAYDVKLHIQRVHQNKFAAMCDICGMNFKSKQNLLVHKGSVHQEIQVPEVQCEICKKWLKDGRSLYKYMYKHRDELSGKKFTCPDCGIEKPTR